MYELLWTLLGIAVAFAVMRLWPQDDRADDAAATPAEAPQPSPPPEPADVPQPTVLQQANVPVDAQRLALALADELASLVSGVEGRAHHLIEAAPSRTQLPKAAEAMLESINRLRMLHSKLAAVGHSRDATEGTTDVARLIAGLGDELQQMQLGLELHWEPPPALPDVAACPVAMHDALLWICAALLRAERGATRLTFVAERSFSDEHPTIKIDVILEWITESHRSNLDKLTQDSFTLDLNAASHLLDIYDGELTLTHLPGKSVCAVVRIPMEIPPEMIPTAHVPSTTAASAKTAAHPTNEAEGDTPPGSLHDFGGALVLESDPALRAVLSRELKASGRAVFACADGESAHTFLEATPDRFELLIIDDVVQIAPQTPLARTIRECAPNLKVCLLTPKPAAPQKEWPTAYCLQKPFGVHELRRTLASILTGG